MYDASLKARWDNQNVMDYAVEQGLEQGLQQGLQQGLEKGLQQGRAEGQHEKAVEIALQMKKEGLPPTTIAKFTGLKIEEIELL